MNNYKFIPLNEYLIENESQKNNFGCIMLFANAPDWPRLVRRVVKKEDIFTAPDDEYGYEDDAHITILFGIHDDEVNKNEIFNFVRNMPVMKFEIDNISIFENERFDVVKFDVPKTPKLMTARKKAEHFPHTKTFPDYNPHITIAYVNKGMGRKYERRLLKPITLKFKTGVYSEPNYKKSYFDLQGQHYKK